MESEAIRASIISDMLHQRTKLEDHLSESEDVSIPDLLVDAIDDAVEAYKRADRSTLRADLIRTLAVAFEWVEYLDREETRHAATR